VKHPVIPGLGQERPFLEADTRANRLKGPHSTRS
jgi:hypothetical protein